MSDAQTAPIIEPDPWNMLIDALKGYAGRSPKDGTGILIPSRMYDMGRVEYQRGGTNMLHDIVDEMERIKKAIADAWWRVTEALRQLNLRSYSMTRYDGYIHITNHTNAEKSLDISEETARMSTIANLATLIREVIE